MRKTLITVIAAIVLAGGLQILGAHDGTSVPVTNPHGRTALGIPDENEPVGVPNVVDVPTLSRFGVLSLGAALAAAGLLFLRGRNLG